MVMPLSAKFFTLGVVLLSSLSVSAAGLPCSGASCVAGQDEDGVTSLMQMRKSINLGSKPSEGSTASQRSKKPLTSVSALQNFAGGVQDHTEKIENSGKAKMTPAEKSDTFKALTKQMTAEDGFYHLPTNKGRKVTFVAKVGNDEWYVWFRRKSSKADLLAETKPAKPEDIDDDSELYALSDGGLDRAVGTDAQKAKGFWDGCPEIGLGIPGCRWHAWGNGWLWRHRECPGLGLHLPGCSGWWDLDSMPSWRTKWEVAAALPVDKSTDIKLAPTSREIADAEDQIEMQMKSANYEVAPEEDADAEPSADLRASDASDAGDAQTKTAPEKDAEVEQPTELDALDASASSDSSGKVQSLSKEQRTTFVAKVGNDEWYVWFRRKSNKADLLAEPKPAKPEDIDDDSELYALNDGGLDRAVGTDAQKAKGWFDGCPELGLGIPGCRWHAWGNGWDWRHSECPGLGLHLPGCTGWWDLDSMPSWRTKWEVAAALPVDKSTSIKLTPTPREIADAEDQIEMQMKSANYEVAPEENADAEPPADRHASDASDASDASKRVPLAKDKAEPSAELDASDNSASSDSSGKSQTVSKDKRATFVAKVGDDDWYVWFRRKSNKADLLAEPKPAKPEDIDDDSDLYALSDGGLDRAVGKEAQKAKGFWDGCPELGLGIPGCRWHAFGNGWGWRHFECPGLGLHLPGCTGWWDLDSMPSWRTKWEVAAALPVDKSTNIKLAPTPRDIADAEDQIEMQMKAANYKVAPEEDADAEPPTELDVSDASDE